MLASLELYGRDSSVTRIEAGSRARDWKHLLAEFLAGSGSGELGCIMRPCQSRQLRFCAIRALCARARARRTKAGELSRKEYGAACGVLVINIPRNSNTRYPPL